MFPILTSEGHLCCMMVNQDLFSACFLDLEFLKYAVEIQLLSPW